MKERLLGFYATRIQLSLSALSRRWRNFYHRVRGRKGRFLHATALPSVRWADWKLGDTPRLWEGTKASGNVRLSELGILAVVAMRCRNGSNLFEMGTFDGRTTPNLATNAPDRCRTYTLNLPPVLPPRFELAKGERHLVDKPSPGARYESHREAHPEEVARIHQLLGDSGDFDFSPYERSCSLVFVDGFHAYDYATADTRTALEMVEDGGVIVGHDYGIWTGVTEALEELEAREGLGLCNIRGTSLVLLRTS